MRKKVIPLILIILFIPMLIPSASATQEYNFSITFELSADSARSFVFANYLKEALKPLGIEVKIKYLPWMTFVGDLLRSTSAGTYWDLTEVGFSGGNSYPEYAWLYDSESFWGGITYQLGDPEFQAYQLADVGLNQTTDINTLIWDIELELNITKRYVLQDQFIEMYMTKLLYDIPTIIALSATSMPTGYGGPNNELWEVKEGIIESRALGAKWDPLYTPALRSSNSSTIRLSIGDQMKFNLDPFQVLDRAQGTQTDWSNQGELLGFDKELTPHPNTAWNFFSGDFGDTWDDDDNPLTPEIGVTQYTFLLRDDVYWHETKDIYGIPVPAQRVDGLDYNLTLTLYDMSRQTNFFDVNGIDAWEVLADWEISTTVFQDDTITLRVPNHLRSVGDLINFGSLRPLPAHLLGGDLTYYNYTSTLNEVSPLVPGMPFSPWDTNEWDSFESFEGNTAIGPYQMVGYEFNVYHSFAARPDYWYPNEWDVNEIYSVNSADIDLIALESAYGVDFSLFGGSNNFAQDAYYWTYDEITYHAKPTSQNIDYIEYLVIDDPEAVRIKFLAGDIDVLTKSAYSVPNQILIENDPNFITKQMKTNAGPRLFIFNLLHEHLRKFNVRNAIAHALDMNVIIDFYHGNAVKANSPDFGHQRTNEAWGIPYDLNIARSLMMLEGYFVPAEFSLPNIQVDDSIDYDNAINFNLDANQFESIDDDSVIKIANIYEEKSATINYLSFFLGITLIVVIYIKTKK